jgi:hypothetical protein
MNTTECGQQGISGNRVTGSAELPRKTEPNPGACDRAPGSQPTEDQSCMSVLLAAWDSLGPDNWRKSGLWRDFGEVLTARAKLVERIIDAARLLTACPAPEPTVAIPGISIIDQLRACASWSVPGAKLTLDPIACSSFLEHLSGEPADRLLLKAEEYRGFIRASELLEAYGPEVVWQLAQQHRDELETLPKTPETPSSVSPMLPGQCLAVRASTDGAQCLLDRDHIGRHEYPVTPLTKSWSAA